MTNNLISLDIDELSKKSLLADTIIKYLDADSSIAIFKNITQVNTVVPSKEIFGRIDFYYSVSSILQNHEVVNLDPIYKVEESQVINVRVLPHKNLRQPLNIIIEPDGEGFLARTVDLPLYSYGDSKIEAINNLKDQIESLYDELMEDDEFSEEWLNYKRFLREIIANE